MKQKLFNDWADYYKPEATLEDFVSFVGGYDARDIEVYNLKAEITRLQEIISEKAHG